MVFYLLCCDSTKLVHAIICILEGHHVKYGMESWNKVDKWNGFLEWSVEWRFQEL